MNMANHVVPGDILLLRSRGFRTRGNLLAQAIARRGRGRFTHVAVVLNDDLIADAVPQHGITLRKWHDIQQHYDLETSRVARNDKLAADPDAPARVMQRATYYYRQRYDVKPVLRAEQADAPCLPCLQFVGALYDDLHVSADANSALAAWAHDIDIHTQSGAWHQFKLADYGLIQPLRTAYSPTVSSYAPAPAPASIVAEPLLHNLQQHYQLCRFNAQLAALRHSVGGVLQQLPQQTAEFARHWQPPSGLRALGGEAMLRHWRQLFLAADAMPPGRMTWLELFASRTGRVQELARQLRSALASFEQLLATTQQLVRAGLANGQQVDTLCLLAARLLEWGGALVDDETVDEVLLRVQNYPQDHADLLELDGDVEYAALALGASSLAAISDLDLVRLDWVGQRQAALYKALARLRNLMTLFEDSD